MQRYESAMYISFLANMKNALFEDDGRIGAESLLDNEHWLPTIACIEADAM